MSTVVVPRGFMLVIAISCVWPSGEEFVSTWDKFELDQSDHNLAQAIASPGQTESQVIAIIPTCLM